MGEKVNFMPWTGSRAGRDAICGHWSVSARSALQAIRLQRVSMLAAVHFFSYQSSHPFLACAFLPLICYQPGLRARSPFSQALASLRFLPVPLLLAPAAHLVTVQGRPGNRVSEKPTGATLAGVINPQPPPLNKGRFCFLDCFCCSWNMNVVMKIIHFIY